MKNKKSILIILIIVIIIISVYFVLKYINNNDYNEETFIRNYEVNEFIPTYISDQDMAKIYLKDYVDKMYTKPEMAYSLIDEEYRSKRFGNYENYQNYVSNLTFTSFTLKKYYIEDRGKYKLFGVYDNNGNLFIFKTNGVMQYSVYLDDTTVEI